MKKNGKEETGIKKEEPTQKSQEKPKKKESPLVLEKDDEIFSKEDYDELNEIYKNTSSTKLKLILKPTLDEIRSTFVTQILNKELMESSDDIEAPEKPVLSEFNKMEYLESKIRGFKAKVRSLKEALGKIKTKKIKETLVACNGNEEKALNCLLCGDKIPELKEVPAEVLKEHEDTNKRIMENFEKRLEKFKKRKKERIKFLENVDSTTINVKAIDGRIVHVRKALSSFQKTAKIMSALHGESIEDDDELDEGKLYLPGEKQAIFNDESRVFTFKCERNISNEVQNIHFRIAESQFFRLSNNMNYAVTEVKYIVTPHIIRKYEIQKKDFASQGYNNQYLMFSQHATSDSGIKWIFDNNFGLGSFKNGRRFSCNMEYCHSYIQNQRSILLCLVISGREKRKNVTDKKYSKPSGYDTIVNADCNDIVVFKPDCVLPYYVVKYEPKTARLAFNNSGQNTDRKHLDEKWKDFEKSAQADKKMDEMKVFYQMQLIQKEKERKMGKLDPNKPDFFSEFYQKQVEREKKKMPVNMENYGNEEVDEDLNEDDGEIDFEDDDSGGDFTPTPSGDVDEEVFDVEEGEGEGEDENLETVSKEKEEEKKVVVEKEESTKEKKE